MLEPPAIDYTGVKPWTTSMPLQMKGLLWDENKPDPVLQKHQTIAVNAAMSPFSRGLLVCAGMGSGKTMVSVSVIARTIEQDPGRKIIFMANKSLIGNFEKELNRYIRMRMESKGSTDKYPSHWKNSINFVTMNASNMLDKMSELFHGNEKIKKCLLVIDEAHNFFNSITNGAKNAIGLYDRIIGADDIRLLFLTGTPMINSPFEIVPAMNMLRGPLPRVGLETRPLLFSEKYSDFANWFIQGAHIKNADKFQNRIYGLISYNGNLYEPDKTPDGFPEKLPIKIRRIPMSTYQFSEYLMAREDEREEASVTTSFKGQSDGRFSSNGSSASASYRVNSRQIRNVCLPEYAIVKDGKRRIKDMSNIQTADYLSAEYSPKTIDILKNVESHAGTKGIIYSQFVTGEGLAWIAGALRASGWEELITNGESVSMNVYEIMSHTKRFCIISGEISSESRSHLIRLLNHESNKYGEKCALCLLSGAVAEGISLLHQRHIHMMEPFWNLARIEQVETRGIRWKSHLDLPENERNVQPYMYLADYPAHANKQLIEKEKTTDVHLWEKAVESKKLIVEFMQNLVAASVDCPHMNRPGSGIQCLMCSPTDKPLSVSILSKAISGDNPCEPLVEEKIKTEEIEIDGVTYQYIPADSTYGLRVFKWNPATKIHEYIPWEPHVYKKIQDTLDVDIKDDLLDFDMKLIQMDNSSPA